MSRAPWLNPNDTIEALEVLESAEDCLRNTAIFGSLRKALRLNLENQAAAIREFSQRGKQPVIDSALWLAIEECARRKRMSVNTFIIEALESYVSAMNRGKR